MYLSISCNRVCVCVCLYLCLCLCLYLCLCLSVPISLSLLCISVSAVTVSVSVCTHICVCVCTYICVFAVYLSISCNRVCVCVCTYICVCITVSVVSVPFFLRILRILLFKCASFVGRFLRWFPSRCRHSLRPRFERHSQQQQEHQ